MRAGKLYVGNPLKTHNGYDGYDTLYEVSFEQCCWSDTYATNGSLQQALGHIEFEKLRLGRYDAGEILKKKTVPWPYEVSIAKRKTLIKNMVHFEWMLGSLINGSPLMVVLDEREEHDLPPLLSASLLGTPLATEEQRAEPRLSMEEAHERVMESLEEKPPFKREVITEVPRHAETVDAVARNSIEAALMAMEAMVEQTARLREGAAKAEVVEAAQAAEKEAKEMLKKVRKEVKDQEAKMKVKMPRAKAKVAKVKRWEPEEEASIREFVAELGTTRAGKGGKPDRVSVSAKNWAVISERLGTGRSTAALRQHWDIMNGKRHDKRQGGKKAAKAGGASYGY